MHCPPQNLTIATTGASGSLFLRQLLFAVDRDKRVKTVNFIASDSALRVIAEELGLRGRSNLVARSSDAPPARFIRNPTPISAPTLPAVRIPLTA